MRSLVLSFAALGFASALSGQQVADSAFHFQNTHPAFADGEGPIVCVDAGHHNFHTLDGRYFAFGKLLREDGFRTNSLAERFDHGVLDNCAVLVIANALAAPAGQSGSDFNASAFQPQEIRAVLEWVVAGGRLLLIMDHAPFPAAAAHLAAPLGVLPLNGSARYRLFGELPEAALSAAAETYGTGVDSLRQWLGSPGTLGDHPILRGRRGVDEPVRTLMTFGGSAFYPARSVRPLLLVPSNASGTVPLQGLSQEHAPRYELAGWLVGGAREVGVGRVVVLGEAATCTAQLAGTRQPPFPMGMNNPLSVDNARFCLNAVRWLVGVI